MKNSQKNGLISSLKDRRIKINGRLLNKIKNLYLKDNSLKNIKEILNKKYGTNVCLEAIRKRLQKSGIKMRSRDEVTKLFLVKKLSKNQIKRIIELYTKNRFSIKKIERTLYINRRFISKILRENKIPIIEKEKAMLLANTIHRKIPFKGDEKEKAYLTGLTEGDLYVRKKNKRTLCLSTGTTHRSFLQLVRSTFKRYGPVYCYPTKYKEEYRWNINAELDSNSFNFLLKRKEIISLLSEDSFIYFLAGFIDSDGSVIIRKAGKYFQYAIRVFNQDISLLNYIKNKLYLLGFNPHINLNEIKGAYRIFKHSIIVYNKDYYYLELSQKKEVIRLLKMLPIRHPEKILRKKIIFDSKNKKLIYHKDVKKLLKRVREHIRLDVKKFVSEAKEQLIQRNYLNP